MTRRKLLAVTTSPLPYPGNITDGPGYRMWNLLRGLAADHDVHILSLYESFHRGQHGLPPITAEGIPIERLDASPKDVGRRIREWDPDVLYAPWSAAVFLGRANRDLPTLLDYVGPGLLEEFVKDGRVPVSLLHLQLESFWAGDRFLTTTTRERYYLIGLLAASRRLSTEDFSRLDPLVHVVRMTPPPEPAAAPPRLPRRADELVVLLAGAFLPWYDYARVTAALRAIGKRGRGGLRFLVIGGNPRSAPTESAVRKIFEPFQAQGLVELFNLVPFEERAGFYASADIGLLIPPASVEDDLSARTRVVDYLWAGLPLVTPGRDEYSGLALEAGAAFGYDGDGLGDLLGGLAANRARVADAKARIPPLLGGPFHPARALAPIRQFLEAPEVTRRSARQMRTPEAGLIALREILRRARGR